jgi:regulator of replication initiation timing
MLEDLRKNIEKLIALYEAEKVENQRLREELAQSKEAGAACKKQISDLETRIETQTLTQAFTAGGASDRAAAKETIDKLIKEIDKCISWLES